MPNINKKRKVNPTEPMNLRKYEIGDRVYGIRHPNAQLGVLVGAYVSINTNRYGTFRNPTYVVRCDSDGKERKFMQVRKESIGITIEERYNIK